MFKKGQPASSAPNAVFGHFHLRMTTMFCFIACIYFAVSGFVLNCFMLFSVLFYVYFLSYL